MFCFKSWLVCFPQLVVVNKETNLSNKETGRDNPKAEAKGIQAYTIVQSTPQSFIKMTPPPPQYK